MVPKNLPETIYKFRAWGDEFGKDPLEKLELYFASPANFNDPFDSKIKYNYKLLNETEKKAYIEKLLSKGKKSFDNLSVEIPHEGRVHLINKMMNEDPIHFQSWMNNLEADLIDNIVGILSFSHNWNNVLMWSHYAKNHEGYCIGFNEKKLRESGRIEYGGKVEYLPSNTFPSLHPMMDEHESFYKKFFTKSFDWSYEEEYRLINIIPPSQSNNLSVRKLKIEPDFIEDVTLGLKISEKHRSEIIELCHKYGVKVYQAAEKDFQFIVDRIEIST
jgi:hypothetical protein